MAKNAEFIIEAVKQQGGEVDTVDIERQIFHLRYKGKEILICRKFGIGSDKLSHTAFTKFKDVTHLLLERSGLPTPATILVRKKDVMEDVNRKVISLQPPLVVKIVDGSNSRGVFVGVEDTRDAMEKVTQLISQGERVMIQEMAQGSEYRLLALGGKVIAALQMVPPFVDGDGRSTVKELMEAKQEQLEKTPQDSHLEMLLSQQDQTLETVPAVGQRVFLRRNSCLAEGGMTIDVTDLVHPSFVRLAAAAAEAVKLDLAGIDVICQSIEKDVDDQTCSIIEINGKPDIDIHHAPSQGQSRNVSTVILDYLINLQ